MMFYIFYILVFIAGILAGHGVHWHFKLRAMQADSKLMKAGICPMCGGPYEEMTAERGDAR